MEAQFEASGDANPVWQAISTPAHLHLPDFTTFTPEALSEASERAVAQLHDSVESIIASETAADFHNTTLVLETARYPLLLLSGIVHLLTSNCHTPELAPTLARVTAQLSQAQTDVSLNSALFDRLESVSTVNLNPEDRRHHDLTVEEFVHAGARLDEDSRAAVATIEAELTNLQTEFSQVLLDENNRSALHFTQPADLAGLDSTLLSAAAARAQEQGLEGWVLSLSNTSQQDALLTLSDPATRRHLLNTSLSRGSMGDAYDTRGIVSDITALRAALAGLMGYRSFAAWVIDRNMAGNPEEASGLLAQLLEPAQEQLAAELDLVSDLVPSREMVASDVTYLMTAYSEKTFGVDPIEVSRYFPFEQVLYDGVLYAAAQLYSLTFTPSDQTAWHPDVIVLEAREDDRVIGLICIDPYARDSKRGGAWMTQLVPGAWFSGEEPILTMTLNIRKPAAGEPVLLSPDTVRTMFHEFGHVLHGLFSQATYASRAGTFVPRDFVEFPSQFNEMWMFHPQVLPNYAAHVTTGEGMPAELVERLQQSEAFGQGFGTVEYLAAALLDLGWHSLEPGEQVDAVLSFESEVLAASGFNPLVPPRYRSPYFAHAFAHGYAAGYYGYLWSELLAAHSQEWFEDQGGLNPEAGAAFRKALLAPGNSVNLENAVERFFNGKPGVAALLRRRGLPVPTDEGAAAGVSSSTPFSPEAEAPHGDSAAGNAAVGGAAAGDSTGDAPSAAISDGLDGDSAAGDAAADAVSGSVEPGSGAGGSNGASNAGAGYGAASSGAGAGSADDAVQDAAQSHDAAQSQGAAESPGSEATQGTTQSADADSAQGAAATRYEQPNTHGISAALTDLASVAERVAEEKEKTQP